MSWVLWTELILKAALVGKFFTAM